MRKIIFIVLLCQVVGCSGWTYNGISGEELRRLNMEHTAGFATAFAVHTLNHFAAIEMTGNDWHVEFRAEVIDEPTSGSEAAWIGRAGFIGQLAVGYAAKLSGCKSDFWRGYNMGTLAEISLYPLQRKNLPGGGDDFAMIDRSSDARLEWGIYEALAIGLNLGNAKSGIH